MRHLHYHIFERHKPSNTIKGAPYATIREVVNDAVELASTYPNMQRYGSAWFNEQGDWIFVSSCQCANRPEQEPTK